MLTQPPSPIHSAEISYHIISEHKLHGIEAAMYITSELAKAYHFGFIYLRYLFYNVAQYSIILTRLWKHLFVSLIIHSDPHFYYLRQLALAQSQLILPLQSQRHITRSVAVARCKSESEPGEMQVRKDSFTRPIPTKTASSSCVNEYAPSSFSLAM